MDYYNLTVFEWKSALLGAQSTVCGGGRYDQLIETLGGKPAPGIGFGLGMERLMLMLEAAGRLPTTPVPDAYALVMSADQLPQVMPVLDALRVSGCSVLMHAAGKDGRGSLKSQFKRADASGASYALIFGVDELAAALVTIKPLRAGEGAAQFQRALADAAAWAQELRKT